MEYKFKTIYQGKLIKCIPIESNNLIICIDLLGELEFKKIGRLREEKGWREDLPVLPVFQYTGQKDCNDKEIYDGHICAFTENRINGFKFHIRWNAETCSFNITGKPSYPIDEPLEKRVCGQHIKIITHSALENLS